MSCRAACTANVECTPRLGARLLLGLGAQLSADRFHGCADGIEAFGAAAFSHLAPHALVGGEHAADGMFQRHAVDVAEVARQVVRPGREDDAERVEYAVEPFAQRRDPAALVGAV